MLAYGQIAEPPYTTLLARDAARTRPVPAMIGT